MWTENNRKLHFSFEAPTEKIDLFMFLFLGKERETIWYFFVCTDVYALNKYKDNPRIRTGLAQN